MKIRSLFAASAVVAALTFPATAHAADANGLGESTQLILSADRLLPLLSYTSAKITDTRNPGQTVESTTTGTTLSLLWGDDVASPAKIHTTPRVGFDFSLGASHFTVGGALAFAFSLGGSTEREVNGDTIFEIGSATKVFTSLLALDMARRSEVNLDDPVTKYLPEHVAVPEFEGKQITLRHLAAQESGLPWNPDELDAILKREPGKPGCWICG